MPFTHDNLQAHFTEHDALIRQWSNIVISAMEKTNMQVTTDAMIYYGLFQRGISVDDAAKVVTYLSNDCRIERSGVLIFIRSTGSSATMTERGNE